MGAAPTPLPGSSSPLSFASHPPVGSFVAPSQLFIYILTRKMSIKTSSPAGVNPFPFAGGEEVDPPAGPSGPLLVTGGEMAFAAGEQQSLSLFFAADDACRTATARLIACASRCACPLPPAACRLPPRSAQQPWRRGGAKDAASNAALRFASLASSCVLFFISFSERLPASFHNSRVRRCFSCPRSARHQIPPLQPAPCFCAFWQQNRGVQWHYQVDLLRHRPADPHGTGHVGGIGGCASI